MRVLSLFDGMACGMLAFQRAGIEVDRYVAYEIDKYAIQASSHNFPGIEHRGDVFKADFTEFEGFDFVVGGSPCTYWSIAQTKNRETEAHGIGWELFQQYVRAIREAGPRFFVYENNKSMSDAIRMEISETFGFEPIYINSALVSAQNRQRLYWVGVRNADGTYHKADIEQPEDRGILLKDVLDEGWVTDKDKSHAIIGSIARTTHREYFQKAQGQMVAEPVNVTEGGKSQTIKAQYGKNSIANFVGYTSTYGATGVAEPVVKGLDISRTPKDGKRALTSDKGYCLLANPNSDMTPMVIESSVCVDSSPQEHYAIDVRGMSYGLKEAYDKDEGVVARLDMPGSHDILTRVYGSEGKSPTLTAMGGGHNEPKVFSESRSVRSVTDTPVYEVKDGRITIKGKQYPIKLADGHYIIRKLTVNECKRLQTVPEDYDMTCISNTQAYKCLGNGWTVEVIAHLIKGALGTDLSRPHGQMSLEAWE